MKVLVTGGGGILGSALAARLLASGHEVVAYDLMDAGLPASVQFVEGDVRDVDHLAKAAGACEAGIHLAVMSGESQAADMLSVNVLGAYGFLRAARDARFRNAVIVSSAPVHLAASAADDGFPLPTSAEDDHLYDLTKALQEVIGRDFHSHGLPVLCLRLGHIVRGAEEVDLDRSIPLSEESYCRGGWVALEDVVEASAAALEADPAPETFEVLNIVGARGARDRFRVAAAEARLGIAIGYDFAAYD